MQNYKRQNMLNQREFGLHLSLHIIFNADSTLD